MRSRAPTWQEIDELIAFLPLLYAEGFSPVRRWHGGTARPDGVITMPWPEYDERRSRPNPTAVAGNPALTGVENGCIMVAQ